VGEGEYGANTLYTCMQMEKWYLLKYLLKCYLEMEGGKDEGEWWRG
jgi:hypothetical protein